jgi:hypothetical protein
MRTPSPQIAENAVAEKLQAAARHAEQAAAELAAVQAEVASREHNSPVAESSPSEEPPSEPAVHAEGEEHLRSDPTMTLLMDALHEGRDIGHYGRLTFAMVARHFLTEDEVIAYLASDKDFSEEQARLMLHQVMERDYNPPRRERLLQWQSEQDFQFVHADDPDSGNLYRNLKFPTKTYEHIEGYEAAKSEAA